eukprot:COSAG02_NODE_13229_length_1422_cov_3.480726_1_plen_59_part_00
MHLRATLRHRAANVRGCVGCVRTGATRASRLLGSRVQRHDVQAIDLVGLLTGCPRAGR